MKGIFQLLTNLRRGKNINTYHNENISNKETVDFRDISQREDDYKEKVLVKSLEKNLKQIDAISGSSFDLSINQYLAGPEEVPCAIIFFDGLVDQNITDEIFRIVKIDTFKTGLEGLNKKDIYSTVKDRLLSGEYKEVQSLEDLFAEMSRGSTALLFDGTPKAILVETQGWETRAIEEPDAEKTIRASREGFVENIKTNVGIIRRRIRTPNLWIENLQLGSLSRTEMAFAYIKGLAGEEMLEEVRSRLERIDIDAIQESGQVEEFIKDHPLSPFPNILRTERPDRAVGAILEGRIVLFTNHTPFVLIMPGDFNIFLQAPDDYNEIWPIGTLIRFLRFISFISSIFLPGIYVAVLTFHQELLPTSLLLDIQAAREGVPFPVVAEMLMMDFVFEVLREAGLRLPSAIGPAISIVGGLILGDAAIRAGLVSPGVVIIVAFTAVSSFSNPAFNLAITGRMLRFLLTFLGASFGLLGIQVGFLLLLVHMVSLRSFGYPMFTPFAPFIWQDMKDNIIRIFSPKMVHRPKLLGFREPVRQRPGQHPRPREKGREPFHKSRKKE